MYPKLAKIIIQRANRCCQEERLNHHILGFMLSEALPARETIVQRNITFNIVAVVNLSIGCEIKLDQLLAGLPQAGLRISKSTDA